MTPRMLQGLKGDLGKYHELFTAGRCSGWELEELMVRALKSDTQAQHSVFWKEAGHDDKADIQVRTNGETHFLQIKSGQLAAKMLKLSGHRLGRFDGDLAAITRYLNSNSAEIITVPYRKIDDQQGRRHVYQVCYVDAQILTGLDPARWTQKGRRHVQSNQHGVEFGISPSLSWQVWWRIPAGLIDKTPEFSVV